MISRAVSVRKECRRTMWIPGDIVSPEPHCYAMAMSSQFRISGRMIAAARALAGVSRAHFAAASDLDIAALRRLETAGSAWVSSPDEVDALRRGLEHYGVLLIEESTDMGAGVRLKFTRSDVSQIARLEGEGGIVGSDDAP